MLLDDAVGNSLAFTDQDDGILHLDVANQVIAAREDALDRAHQPEDPVDPMHPFWFISAPPPSSSQVPRQPALLGYSGER